MEIVIIPEEEVVCQYQGCGEKNIVALIKADVGGEGDYSKELYVCARCETTVDCNARTEVIKDFTLKE